MSALGETVIAMLRSARRDVLVVAPFMRTHALEVLFRHVPAGIQTTVVTRWRPCDVVSGVSELGVYDVVSSIGGELYLRYDLHAKLFGADDRCLVGSANVTDTALGWRCPENLELLVTVPRAEPEVARFEEGLLKGAIRATNALRDRLAAFLENHQSRLHVAPEVVDGLGGQLPPDWIPRIRNPEELFTAYGGSTDVGRAALQAMHEVLNQIGVAPGMNESMFREWVAAAISQTPLIHTVVEHIEQKGEVTESDMAAFVRAYDLDPKVVHPRELLENLERWMTCFFPAQYETARESIKLVRAQPVWPRRSE